MKKLYIKRNYLLKQLRKLRDQEIKLAFEIKDLNAFIYKKEQEVKEDGHRDKD